MSGGPGDGEQRFTLGKYWLDRERDAAGRPVSPSWYRYWYEPDGRRIRRRSMRTKDFGEAKERLASIVIAGEPKTRGSYLATVLETYFSERTDRLPSAGPARRAGAVLLEFFEKSEERIRADRIKVEHFTDRRQEAFIRWCHERLGHSVKTISRNLSVLAAALHHCKIKEGPRIDYADAHIAKLLDVPDPVPGRWIPSDDQLAAFLDALGSQAAFRWCLFALNTLCRPDAGIEAESEQWNDEAGLIALNPQGRRQTKKYRPTVRVPWTLAWWLEDWGEGPFVGLGSVDSLQSAFHRTRKKTGMPKMVPYSLRHKMTTVLRAAGVPEDQVSVQLGHRRPQFRTTGLYGEYAASYLSAAVEAIEDYMIRLDARTKRGLLAPRPRREQERNAKTRTQAAPKSVA